MTGAKAAFAPVFGTAGVDGAAAAFFLSLISKFTATVGTRMVPVSV